MEFIARWRGQEPIERYLRQPDYGELLDFLWADLARVEAERDHWKDLNFGVDEEAELEAAQARVAELEGSLRELLDEHTTDTMIPYWEGDVQHLRYGNCECSACERARANLAKAQNALR